MILGEIEEESLEEVRSGRTTAHGDPNRSVNLDVRSSDQTGGYPFLGSPMSRPLPFPRARAQAYLIAGWHHHPDGLW